MMSLSGACTAGCAAVRYLTGLALALGLSLAAQAAPIDLNQLYMDPGAPISIAADGSSATFTEDLAIFSVFLSNIPGAGDPELVTASNGATLSFDYDFAEGAGNDDEFHFAVLDGTTGNPLGGAFDLAFTASASGTASFDLTSLIGTTLGLQFELDAFDTLADSILTISNLRLDIPTVEPPGVSEPGSIALIFAGLLGALVARRKRRSRHALVDTPLF